MSDPLTINDLRVLCPHGKDGSHWVACAHRSHDDTFAHLNCPDGPQDFCNVGGRPLTPAEFADIARDNGFVKLEDTDVEALTERIHHTLPVSMHGARMAAEAVVGYLAALTPEENT